MSGAPGGRKGGAGGLRRGEPIKCNVDDLQLEQGVIVVSFLDKGNLYQGVLLQLNRERGIPAGISFPKDYFSEEKKPVEANPPAGQSPPVNQRNTYFQESSNGGGSLRSLRRVIKTPARFKNSRMSLRPVSRPVLCAKCGVVCNNEKGGGKGKAAAGAEGGKTETVTGVKKVQGQGQGGSPKKGQQGQQGKPPLVPKVPVEIGPVVEDPARDFNYEGMGSKGIVDNAWKRPLSKPLKQPSSSRSSPSTGRKARLKGANPLKAQVSSSSTSSPEFEEGMSESVFHVTRAPDAKRRVENLKLCIRKLTLARTSGIVKDGESEQLLNSTEMISSTTTATNTTVPPPVKVKIPLKRSVIKLRRRNSAANTSYKFRDRQGSGPTWRTRKVSTMSDPDADSASKEGVDEEPQEDRDQDGLLMFSSAESQANTPSVCSDFGPTEINSDPEEASPSTVSSEPVKTPVIKITFGSSGNGVVLQIPPRDKNNHENSSQHGHQTSEGTSDSKAVRKALKRAKKEAKKRLSNGSSSNASFARAEDEGYSSMLPLTSITATSTSPGSPKPALAPLTVHLNSSHSTAPDSQGSLSSGTPREGALLEHTDSSAERKKKKKAKKRKKQKDHKENDVEPHSNSSSGCESQSLLTVLPGPGSSPLIKSEFMNSSSNLQISSPKRRRSSSSTISPTATCKKEETAKREKNSSNGFGENPSENSHQRVCISLKRINNQSNSYIPWNCSSYSSGDDHNGNTSDSFENEEPHDFQDATFPNDASGSGDGSVESVEAYDHSPLNRQYKLGDVVWGKSGNCPWWPGKIIDIQVRGSCEARAKIAWYKSTTQSLIAFTNLFPFTEYYETKYTKNRKRGSYQQAVREALIDAHPVNVEDFGSD